MSKVRILGPDGTPAVRERTIGRELATSFQAASRRDTDLEAWNPQNPSGASALFGDRDPMIARVHDLARNDGWASGGVARQVDAIIGSGWRLSAKPNARSLGLRTATGAVDYDAADEFASDIEAAWRDYVDDPDFWCDVGRRTGMGGILALAFRHRVMDGEALAAILWRPRGGPFATAVQVIDPDRLSNPMGGFEQTNLRQGVEMDRDGAPVAYHVRVSHPGDLCLGMDPWRWERVPRATSFGRRVMVHAFEPDRAGQVRGTSPLAPIVKRLKMLGRYDEAEMQAAVLNAILAAFVESPYDHQQLAELMSDPEGSEELSAYQRMRLGFHEAAPMRLGGVKVNFTAPGEKVTLTNPTHPNSVFEHFTRASLRNVASAMGLTYEQLSNDWGQVNYSSARAALLEVWRGFTARKDHFAAQFMQPIYAAWLEEALDRGIVVPPKGAPAFRGKKAAYCAAKWIGPARGWVDPLKEAYASIERVDALMSTREREGAEQGVDWEEDVQQIARERKRLRDLGIEPEAALRAQAVGGQQASRDAQARKLETSKEQP